VQISALEPLNPIGSPENPYVKRLEVEWCNLDNRDDVLMAKRFDVVEKLILSTEWAHAAGPATLGFTPIRLKMKDLNKQPMACWDIWCDDGTFRYPDPYAADQHIFGRARHRWLADQETS